jgi:tetratricopeptide (TPR) repeat protein
VLARYRTGASAQPISILRFPYYREPDDADLATDYANLGRAYGVTGQLAKADELYATSVKTFRAAIVTLPEMKENYSRRLQRTLAEYAQVKDAEGQADVASNLRQQANDIGPVGTR